MPSHSPGSPRLHSLGLFIQILSSDPSLPAICFTLALDVNPLLSWRNSEASVRSVTGIGAPSIFSPKYQGSDFSSPSSPGFRSADSHQRWLFPLALGSYSPAVPLTEISWHWDSPGGPVVKNLHFCCSGHGFDS